MSFSQSLPLPSLSLLPLLSPFSKSSNCLRHSPSSVSLSPQCTKKEGLRPPASIIFDFFVGRWGWNPNCAIWLSKSKIATKLA